MRTLVLLLCLTSCLTEETAERETPCGPEPVRTAEALVWSPDGSTVSMPNEDWRALQKWANAEHAWGACLASLTAK